VGRASALEGALALLVAHLITEAGVDSQLVLFETKGDKILDRALDAIGDKGLFTTELENALLSGEIDLAVHSLKDLPTDLVPELLVGAYLLPEDPRDALIAAPGVHWESLPESAVVGTSSLRRKAFLTALRPDLNIVPVRGNLQTRVEKWREHGWNGLILAAAGVHRMGWKHLVASYLDPWVCVPSPGQGVLGLEVRRDRESVRALLQTLNNQTAEVSARAERACLAKLGGGCQIPFGAYGEVREGQLHLRAKVADVAGEHIIVQDLAGPPEEPEKLGTALGQHLIDLGALNLL
jgi:hydroxymethylbilane synthase